MNAAVRRAILSVPVVRGAYRRVRKSYHRRRVLRAAAGYFTDAALYRGALDAEDGRVVDLATRDGLIVSVRRNRSDAWVLAEVFLDHAYVGGLRLADRPVIVDIGGYIGDFALYAVHRLNARRVVVCEPSLRNWELLRRNVRNNRFERRIDIVNKAVTDGRDVMLDVDAPDRGQARVSAYYETSSPRTSVPGVSLGQLVDEYRLEAIDLLKIDCEGGEYDILLSTPSDVFRRIRHLVFEYHEIPGFHPRLRQVLSRLTQEGYAVERRGSLVYAVRPAVETRH